MDKDNNQKRAETALQSILAEIKLGRIEVYRSLLGQTYVHCDHPSFPCINTTIDSLDFHNWLTHYVWMSCAFVIWKSEAHRIISELSGRALSNPVERSCDAEILQTIESEPVIATVLEFMHTHSRHENKMEAFWKNLREFARDRKMISFGKKKFPGGPNVLSRKLKQFKPILERLGIEIEISRSDGSNIVLTKRLDDSNAESSVQSSGANSSSSKALPSVDDRVARLLHFKNAPPTSERK